MQVTIKKWGNSASVRIPVGIMEAAKSPLAPLFQRGELGGQGPFFKGGELGGQGSFFKVGKDTGSSVAAVQASCPW